MKVSGNKRLGRACESVSWLRCALLATAVSFGLVSSGIADEVDYSTQIKPLLTARCYACHGALKQEGGLRLDTGESVRRGGDSGAIIDSANAADSPLIQRLSTAEIAERMPPEGEGEPLKQSEIELLKNWMATGAKSPDGEKPETDPRDHWSFQPIERPSVPGSSEPWTRNTVDAFIAAKHAEQRLAPLSEAKKTLLLRRVYMDLIGLPPSLEELQAFVADESADAYDRVVDRLSASPQYGERWGRHFMDIWRYSDWWGLGEEVRNSQKHIWHWRDWTIESLNADKGYDQMIRELLAADELYPNDLDRLRGGGFLARQYFKFNRTSWMDETVEHTSKAFLGLTMNCCKCHDHKYDPLTQEEYYQFRAIFEPYQLRTEMLPGQADFDKDGLPRPFDCNLDARTYLHRRGDDRQPVTERPLSPGVPSFLTAEPLKIVPVELPPEAYLPGLRPHVVANLADVAQQKLGTAQAQLQEAKQKLSNAEMAGKTGSELEALQVTLRGKELAEQRAQAEVDLVAARAAADRARAYPAGGIDPTSLAQAAARQEKLVASIEADGQAAQLELDLLQAEAAKKDEIQKKLPAAREKAAAAKRQVDEPSEIYMSLSGALKTLESNVETEESRRRPFPKTSTGRRTALAEWIVSRQNPLAARVAVNHVWGRHFGQPLVPTVFDFGRKGLPPTHPELLDWLAAELIENGWSLKDLHRQMVLSGTYRRSGSTGGSQELATVTAASELRDAENRYYWRAPVRRMESQVVRDSLLSLSGGLDLQVGGPSLGVNDEKSRRRSLYFVHSHNEHQTFLSIFDDANVLECYRRSESIVPQQALALANSKASLTTAEAVARQFGDELDDADFIRQVWQTVLCDLPSAEELSECRRALVDLKAAVSGDAEMKRRLARSALVHALLNHNDFLTIR